MNTEVHYISKNLRYNILKLDNDYFIIDKDKPHILIFLLPFLYWVLPIKAQKISCETAHELEMKDVKIPSTGKYNSLAAGVALVGANILGGIASNFDTSIAPILAVGIIILIASILLWFRSSISKKNKYALEKKTSVNEGNNYYEVWLLPKSAKKIFFVIFSTLFFWTFIILFVIAFLTKGNILILVSYSLSFLILLFLNNMNVPHGKNTMKVRIKKIKLESVER